MKSALLLFALCVSAGAQKTIFIDAPPEAQPIKQQIAAKLAASGKAAAVGIQDQADYVLVIQQSEKLNMYTGSGNRGSVVLRDRRTGEDLWSESRGGAFSFRGFSNAAVGRKLGADLVQFLDKSNP